MTAVIGGSMCASPAAKAASAAASASTPAAAAPATTSPTPIPGAEEAPLAAAQVEQLVSILATHESHKVRLQAALLLGRSDDPKARAALLDALEKDPHYTVRAACATVLANLKDVTAVPALITRIGIDPEPFVRAEASRALARFDHAAAIEHALKTFSSPHPSVRAEVIRYLAVAPSPMIEPVLALALGDVAEVAAAANQAISAMPVPARWRFLAQVSAHRDAAVRRGAVLALAAQPSPDAAEIVLAVYDRDIEDEEVRTAAREALRRLRPFLPMSQVFRDASPSAEKHSRARALRLLGSIGGPEATATLLAALGDRDRYLRGIAVMALGELGDPAAVPAVEKLLDNPDNERITHLINNTLRQLRSKQDAQ